MPSQCSVVCSVDAPDVRRLRVLPQSRCSVEGRKLISRDTIINSDKAQNPKKDDELLMSRILFLTSYGTTQSFVDLIDHHHLAEHINDVHITL